MKFELEGTKVNCTLTKEEVEELVERFSTDEEIGNYILQRFDEWKANINRHVEKCRRKYKL